MSVFANKKLERANQPADQDRTRRSTTAVAQAAGVQLGSEACSLPVVSAITVVSA